LLQVEDTGPGLDPSLTGRIFDPFFSTKFAGRGLGLAAVLGIVRTNKGAIRVVNRPGGGASFQVFLPPSRAETADRKVTQPPPRPPLKGAAILVVDDEPAIIELAEQLLVAAGHRVLTALNGREGVDVFRRNADKIDLIMLDLAMPELDGAEACREIRKIRPKVPVILSSGFRKEDALRRFAGLDLAGFIEKPYRSKALMTAIDEALGSTAGPNIVGQT
jgi:CheY-like chemotaxis protein